MSTSELYLCQLVEATLENLMILPDQDDAESIRIGAPILLIDEWLDAETSMVVKNVQRKLQAFADCGAVVICVTHKPDQFALEEGVRRVQLSMGKILSLCTS